MTNPRKKEKDFGESSGIYADRLYTVYDVAQFLQTPEHRVRQWLRDKKLVGYQFNPKNGQWRIQGSDLLRFIRESKNTND